MSRAGTILRVDLATGKVEREATSAYVQDFVGGGAIGAKLIWDGVPPDVSGKDPKNMLTFNTGPLTGTLFGNKCEVMAKSPQLANSPVMTAGLGGQFASEMKFAGYDHLAITGKANEPVYLFINNDNVEIRDAKHLWGLETQQTQVRIKEELKDPDVQIACIGPAGENQNVYAMILHDIQNGACREGLGAVMGSKNLKAVAVRGTKGLKAGDPEACKDLWDKFFHEVKEGRGSVFARLSFREGLAVHVGDYGKFKDRGTWGYYESFVAPPMKKEETMADFVTKYKVHNVGCSFCPIQCGQNYNVPGVDTGGGSCMFFEGYRFLVKSHDTTLWWRASAKAQRYGIEVNSIANITGWLMLLYEKGLITAKDTDGVPMEWGSQEAVMTVIDKVSRAEGFGKLFVDGAVPAAKVIAGGKGLGLLNQDRNRLSGAWHLAMGARRTVLLGGPGATRLTRWANQTVFMHPMHTDMEGIIPWYARELGISNEESEKLIQGWASEWTEKQVGDRDAWRPESVRKKGAYLAASENTISACDISGHCDFLSERGPHFGAQRVGVEEMAQWISATTGTVCTKDMLLDAIQRKRLLEIAYNLLCDLSRAEEEVSYVKALDPVPDGYHKGNAIDLEKSAEVGAEYCSHRGCDPATGLPLREELERLGLGDVATRLGPLLAGPAPEAPSPQSPT